MNQLFIPESQLILSQQPTQAVDLNEEAQDLMYWLQQEILSPEILPYQFNVTITRPKTIVEQLKEQGEAINAMKSELNQAKNDLVDAGKKKQHDYQFLTLHVIEYERMQYLYSEYMRVRLKKITEFCFHYYNERIEPNLAQNERDFLKKLFQLQYNYVFKNFIQYVGARWRYIGVTPRDQEAADSQVKEETQNKNIGNYNVYLDVPGPDLDTYVFVQIKSENPFTVDGILFSAGDQALLPFRKIKTLVSVQSVQLI